MHPTTFKQSAEVKQLARVVRVRLDPEIRKQAILDAALSQFSTRGYEASRIDDIAAGAGLSKGGFYAHFTSKEEVFESLLTRSLSAPQIDVDALLAHSGTARELCAQLVKALYASFSRPSLMAVCKILLAEGHRLPHMVEQWRKRTLDPLFKQIAELFRAAASNGICRQSIVCQEPWLVVSPVVFVIMQRIALGTSAHPSLKEAQRAHVEVLCELLEPPASIE